ncbi:hypothetical protein WS61_07755 [Burkholderia sp. ABCPW 11]|uniref:hypothetical protein n=1 Tax=Burkholderia sp. ABCPW 11 TaxID=1637859 RepID=UPI00075C9FCF|nr:hypothetical protein [Burkholderia sp. ABCPW 11]KVD48697.1 hypothetical protein WS61_07755 [Burkholderia sp. ABCPW 11]
MAKASQLRSESGEFSATFEAGATSICRRYDQQSPDVTLACETTRLDVLASVLLRDSMSPAGAAVMPDDDRAVLIEMLADAAAEVRRLAQLTEAYVNTLQGERAAAA